MQRAVAHLHEGKTVGEISDLLGFEYPQHFTRAFKNTEHITPSQYRESSQGNGE